MSAAQNNFSRTVPPLSGGSRISRRGGADLVGGGTNSRGSYVLKNLYVKTKESGPLGGHAPAAPPGSANAPARTLCEMFRIYTRYRQQ